MTALGLWLLIDLIFTSPEGPFFKKNIRRATSVFIPLKYKVYLANLYFFILVSVRNGNER